MFYVKKTIKLMILFFCFIINFFIITKTAQAQIYINTNVVWDNSEVRVVSDNVFVMSEASLTIEPGTIVKLDEGVLINVMGDLNIIGTSNEPIILTSVKDDLAGGDTNNDGDATLPAPGDWLGIVVSGDEMSANIFFDYAEVKYSSVGIHINDANNVKVYHSSITRNLQLGFFISSVRAVQINYSNIYLNYNTDTGCQIRDGIEYCIDIALMYGGEAPIDAANNYWGSADGPTDESVAQGPADVKGSFISGNINYEPFLTEAWQVQPESERNPVIIVPGILGSYLYNQIGEEVWLNISNMFLDPWDMHLTQLTLQEQGNVGDNILKPEDIFREILGKDFFQGLISELTDKGYQEGVDLFVFPYDWRLDLNIIAGQDSALPEIETLKDKITEITNKPGFEKVDIIAHSMGGLVAKRYMQLYGTDFVDKFIDVATPHLGSVEAFKILMYGDKIGIPFLNPTKVYEISQNFPSIYQMLPSRAYFDNTSQDYNGYVFDIYDADENDVKGRLNYEQSMEFMKNSGRNDILLPYNDNLHSDIDNYSPQDNGVQTYNIIGCSQPTLGKVYILNKEKTGEYEYALQYIEGDGTVPLHSAEHLIAEQDYYVNNTEHPYLPSTDGVKQLVVALLENSMSEFDLAQFSNISQDNSSCSFSGTQISFHSPINMHIYDESGNHVGLNENGDIEMNISGVAYDEINGNKFVFLPFGHFYNIEGQATDAGQFNARIQQIAGGNYLNAAYYREVPLPTKNTRVKIALTNFQNTEMKIDKDGDGDFEETVLPTAILDEESVQDFDKPITTNELTGKQNNEGEYTTPVLLTFNAVDLGDAGLLQTEYSLDNGNTWQVYEDPLIFKDNANYTIMYFSTDRAGNSEILQQLSFTVHIVSLDNIIKTLNLAYQNNAITKKSAYKTLLKKLEFIKSTIEHIAEKTNKRDKNWEKILQKCEQKKNHNWCDKKISPIFEKISVRLNKIQSKIIKIELRSFLQTIDLYNKKNWLREPYYSIIKKDITIIMAELI